MSMSTYDFFWQCWAFWRFKSKQWIWCRTKSYQFIRISFEMQISWLCCHLKLNLIMILVVIISTNAIIKNLRIVWSINVIDMINEEVVWMCFSSTSFALKFFRLFHLSKLTIRNVRSFPILDFYFFIE